MRLLNTKTGQFVEKDPEKTRYAILSHTWDNKGEQTYEELKRIQRRYALASHTPRNSLSVGSQGVTSSSRKRAQDGTLRATTPSSAISPRPPIALGRLTQSEVVALFHMFGEMYGLTSPTPASASIWEDPELSPKVRDACAVARKNGYRYIWIDSCCIDKSSSSELSEAINSMYKWYGLAAVCYAYLADVPPGEDHHDNDSSFRGSLWFQRGWTLQELIAPFDVVFLSEDWAPIGSKHVLVELVESVTKIDQDALLHLKQLDAFSVAQRFSWAANRDTTREEDRAYSLLGIFDINMPTLYGEGDRAFRRLQEQIMQCIPDQSLFAWRHNPSVLLSPLPDLVDTHAIIRVEATKYSDWQNLFAPTPGPFQYCEGTRIPHSENVQLLPSHLLQEIDYTLTPYGIRTQFPMVLLTQDLLLHVIPQAKDIQLTFDSQADGQWYLAILGCEDAKRPGHLLGHVCYIPPSKSNIEFVHCGFITIEFKSAKRHSLLDWVEIFPLSPDTIKHYHLEIKLKRVYIPHNDSTNLLSGLRRQPYAAIKLVLQSKTRDALSSRGYFADLRTLDPAHLTMYWLTLAKDEHTITVEFRYTLEDGGKRFTIDAEAKMSPESRAQVNCASGSDQANRRTASWEDYAPWETRLPHESVELSAVGAGMLTLDLGLDFVGRGVYVVHVDVLRDALSASSAFELPYQGGKEERTEENLHTGEVTTGEAGREEAD